jgi:hypothetical protein
MEDLMEPIKISAKNLGYVALSDFCPRCYYLRLKMNFKLPYSSFPGIFSSIDAYTKRVVHHIIDSSNERPSRQIKSQGSYFEYPIWLKEIGDVIGYETVLHWSKNTYHDEKSNITMHGAMDDILVLSDKSRCCPDYKTAKLTKNQDILFPMYEIQSNIYGILMRDNPKLFLVYMEPETEQESACNNIIDHGFAMCFNAKVVPVETDKKKVRNVLSVTREIYEMPNPPSGRSGCKECDQLDKIIGLLK